MKITEKEISNFLSKKQNPENRHHEEPTTDPTKLYYRSQMSSLYKQEETRYPRVFKDTSKVSCPKQSLFDKKKIKIEIKPLIGSILE